MALKNSWLFPIIQSIHLCGIALLAGPIMIVNLRRLGYALGGHALSDIVGRYRPWKGTGMAIMLATGPILFAADVTRYIHNPAFLFKMAVLAAALVFDSATEDRSKLAAVMSIALWTCVVLGGRAIADFDI